MSSWFKRADLTHTETTTLTNKGILSTASVAIQGVVRSAYSILIGNALTPALLAAVNSAISLALLVSMFWPAGNGTAALKFISRARGAGDLEQIASVASHLGKIQLLSSLILAIPAGLFSYFFQARQDLLTAILVMALVVAWSGYGFARGVLFSIGQIARSVIWDTIAAAVALGLLVSVVILGWTSILLVPLTAGYAIYALAGWPRRHKGSGLPRGLRVEINRFTLWSLVSILASSGFLQLTMIIAQSVGRGNEAGMYAAALTLATPASMLASALSLVLFPSMALATGRGDAPGIRRQADLATRGVVAVVGGIFAILILLSQPIIDIVWGPRYADAIQILPILLAASMLVTFNVGAVNALSAATQSGVRIPALWNVSGLVAGVAAMLILIPVAGIVGVAWGYLVGAAVNGLGPIVFVWRLERMPWTGLGFRAGLGALVVVALSFIRDQLSLGHLGDAGAAVVFLGAWALLMRPNLSMLNSVRKLSNR